MTRSLTLWIVLAVLAALPVGRAAAADEERIVSPIGNFLPQYAYFHLSVKDSATLIEVLKRTGDSPEALAKRLADGERVGAGALSVVFEILAAAADGPITYSRFRVAVHGAPTKDAFVVSVTTRRKGDHLKTAGRQFIRGCLGPKFAKSSKEETLMGLPVLHLTGQDGGFLYFTQSRGHLLFSSSAILLGQILKELQSPSVNTLAFVAEYVEGAKFVRGQLGAEPDGFVYLRDPGMVPGLTALGAEVAYGGLVKSDTGYEDAVFLRGPADGPVGLLRVGAKVPAAWSDLRADRAWIGAAMQPEGVRGLVVALLGEGYGPFLGSLVSAAQGDVEAILSGEGAPLVRVRLKPGAELGSELEMLEGVYRREGDVLLLSEDPDVLAAAKALEERTWDIGKPAALKAPVALLLGAIGGSAGEGRARSAWLFSPLQETEGDPVVGARSGSAEVGPVQAIIASLFR